MFTRILCPVDGTSSSLHALDLAARCAREQGAELTVCTVVDPTKAAALAFGNPSFSAPCLSAMRADAQRMIAEVTERLESIVHSHAVTLTGNTVDAIVSYAEENGCDLIIMGSRRRKGIPRTFLGSVADGVVRHAGVPVMIAGYQESEAHPGHKAPQLATKAS